MLNLLDRTRCRIPLSDPESPGFDWETVEILPLVAGTVVPPPETNVRAVASPKALHVRFDCRLERMELLAPPTPSAGLAEVEHARIEVFPDNDPLELYQFTGDFRGIVKGTRIHRSRGESSLEAIPDTWTKSEDINGHWTRHHGVLEHGWFFEFVIPWKTLGCASPPAVMGFEYARVFATGQAWPRFYTVGSSDLLTTDILEPAEALVGSDSGHPASLEFEELRFGNNKGRLTLGDNWSRRPSSICVRVEGGTSKTTVHRSVHEALPDNAFIPFEFQLPRSVSSHIHVLDPPRLIIEVRDDADATLYKAVLPMDRHLGLLVDERYDEANPLVDGVKPLHDAWLNRIAVALPRLQRLDTNHGTPSDFCLCYEDGSVAANLMADEAWEQLAEIVESRFSTTADRLIGAMLLVGQKSVTNLILRPMFFDTDGRQTYHSAMHEWMGPLSILRYGGGPAVARAAVLAKLLQHLTDPSTQQHFVTRVVSLTRDGGPRQVTRSYEGNSNIAPFVQHPGPIGAVAVNYRGSQTLLDPTGLVYFPGDDNTLSIVEEILSDERQPGDGAGAYSDIYSKLDIEELRRHRPDQLLSRGVFPELCPDEDGTVSPFDPGHRQELRVLAPQSGKSATPDGFVDANGASGVRNAEVSFESDAKGFNLRLTVTGVQLINFSERDRASERVHVAIDTTHGHQEFHHFQISLDGVRHLWLEQAQGIQTLFKHLSTENHTELADLSERHWSADIVETDNSYEVTLRADWTVIDLDGNSLPQVMGMNVWVDGRCPHYEQVFLSPPRKRLPADPFSFADVYLTPARITIDEIDLGVPVWGDNVGSADVTNHSKQELEVSLRSHTRGGMDRWNVESEPVRATIPPGERVSVTFPFYISPTEKMTSGSPQQLTLTATAGDNQFFSGSWFATYGSTVSVYQNYEFNPAENPDPSVEDDDFIEAKIRYICARLPKLERRTTRDGAPSDFVLSAPNGSVEFNLMKEGVLNEIAEFIETRFDTELDRMLGLFYLGQMPSVLRHMSGGHRFMSGAGPLSVLRGNFAGGGGNCGYHSRAFAGMAAHLKLNGRRRIAHTEGVQGHVITAVEWGTSKALIDNDVGHIMLSADGKNLAKFEDFRQMKDILTTAGPGDLARYFTFSDDHVTGYPGIRDEQFRGVFPPGAPKA